MSLFLLANKKMDRNAKDRFTWRLFLSVMQFLLATRGVQAFLYPHPVISTELFFAAFLITPLGGNPPEYGSLELIPGNGWALTNIVSSLPSPGHTRGEFIGLTDNTNRHYPINYQVLTSSSPPPSYIDSTHQEQDVVIYLCSQSGHCLNWRSSESATGASSDVSTVRRAAATSLSRSRLDSPLAHPLFCSNN